MRENREVLSTSDTKVRRTGWGRCEPYKVSGAAEQAHRYVSTAFRRTMSLFSQLLPDFVEKAEDAVNKRV